MLSRLERDGLIIKTVQPSELRTSQVCPTEKAAALVLGAQRIMAGWIDNASGKLTDLEKRSFLELLEKAFVTAEEV